MFSNLISFIWENGPLMNAVFTIAFLLLIRLWTRDNGPDGMKSSMDNIDSKPKKVIKKIGDAIKESSDPIIEECDHFDTLFYGELFISALAAGLVVKYGWCDKKD